MLTDGAHHGVEEIPLSVVQRLGRPAGMLLSTSTEQLAVCQQCRSTTTRQICCISGRSTVESQSSDSTQTAAEPDNRETRI